MVVGLLIISLVAILVVCFYPGWRKKKILSKPISPDWLAILKKQITFYHRLSSLEQKQLVDLTRLFIAKKHFHGCAGLEINDEIKITIAAEACLLLLNRKKAIYPRLRHILVYPSAFRSDHQHHNEDGTISNEGTDLLGASWHFGKVILSWDDVKAGAENIHDGHNVALHEFSHQLDSESGSANGAPLLRANSYSVWANVFSKEFSRLTKAQANQQKATMDYYGATNPAEFFAVATETFYEKPRQMKQKHPELFAELKKYYKVDPRLWQ